MQGDDLTDMNNNLTNDALSAEVSQAAGDEVNNAPEKKWNRWLIVIILILVVVGVGVGVWIWSPWDNKADVTDVADEPDESEVVVEEKESIDETNDDHNLIRLDPDDELVNEVLGRILIDGPPHAGMGRTKFWTDLLWNGGSDDVVLKIAFLNTPEGECRVKNRPDIMKNGWKIKVNQDVCINGQAIRQNMREIFGREVEITDGMTLSYVYIYDKSEDEFYKVDGGGGGGPVPAVIDEVYRVEKDNGRLYIYEYAVTMCMVKVGDIWNREYGCPQIIYPQNEPHMMRWFNIAEDRQESAWDGLPSVEIPEMSSGPYVEIDEKGEYIEEEWRDQVTAVKLSDHAELINRFKWTFRLDEAGNYVFESLKPVRQ